MSEQAEDMPSYTGTEGRWQQAESLAGKCLALACTALHIISNKKLRKACLHVLVLRNTGSRQKAQEMDSPLWLVCKVSLVIG